MTYDQILDALSDTTRRSILEELRQGPLNVAEIARRLPVTRPAVSQHLAVLARAGLVTVHAKGTRRFYALRPGGADALGQYLDEMWGDALAAFAAHLQDNGDQENDRPD